MKTDFIPIDYDYFDFEGKNYTKIVGRNSKGKKICVVDTCATYFWALLKNRVKEKRINEIIEKINKIQLDLKGRKTCVEKTELHEKNFLGKRVKAIKIFATNYKDLHDIADKLGMPEIEKRRGYDLGFITHYIIEKKLKPLQWYEIEGEVLDNSAAFGGIGMHLDVDTCIYLDSLKPIKKENFKPKVLAFDIEVDELQIGKGEILMISLVSENFKKVITWKKCHKKLNYVEHVKDETELLERFIEVVKKISPDFLTGYYSDGFDLPYLKARAQKNRINLALGLDGTQPKFYRGGKTTEKISGITHIDLLRFIQTAYAQYLHSETLSLNEVSKELLGDSKKDFELKHSKKIKETEWEKYFEYNLHDSVLAYNLFEKMWQDLQEFTRVIEEPVFDISRYGLSKYVESYVLHNLERFNEIPEKHPTYDEIRERKKRPPSEGAFVYEPTPGLYENIAIFDFTSMHTSIIVSFNLSKATLLEKKERNAYESPEIDYKGKKTKFYFEKTQGFFPTLAKEIFEQRKKFKTEYKKNPTPITKARSNAFKLLSASIHGYVAFFGARYFSAETSNSILAFVRKLNKESIEKTQKAGYKVIYADTDSVAFTLGKKTKQDTKNFLKRLNSELPGIMELELENFYKRGIWVTKRTGDFGAKKKYALIDNQNKLKIRGFETVRRDWCNLARRVQNDVIKKILENGNETEALNYVKEIAKKIRKREINQKDILIKTQLKKPLSEYKSITPHVIAAKKMEEQKIPIDMGNIIEYYIAETEGKKKLVREKVKLPEEKGEYNIKYYLERQILPAVENIFQVFGVDVKEIIAGKKQNKLSRWL